MAPRGIGLLTLLSLSVIAYCAGCAPLDSTPPRTTDSAENQANADSFRSRTLNLRGVLKDHEGQRLTGVVSVLFAIYDRQTDGAPLWQEVQNVQVDILGHFTALVGSTTGEGIPAYLFSDGETRWLGEQVMLAGEVEQPRVRLVSTPGGLMAEQAVWLPNPGDSAEQPASAKALQVSSDAADSQSSSQQDPTGADNESPTAGGRLPWHRRAQ